MRTRLGKTSTTPLSVSSQWPLPVVTSHALVHYDLLAIDVERIVVSLNFSLELAVHGVVLKHVCHVPAGGQGGEKKYDAGRLYR